MIKVVNLHDIYMKSSEKLISSWKFLKFSSKYIQLKCLIFFYPWHRAYRFAIVNYLISFEDFFYYVSAFACPLSTFQWPCQYLVTTWPTVMTLEIRVYIKSIFGLKILSIWLSRGKNRENNFVSIVWYGNQSL